MSCSIAFCDDSILLRLAEKLDSLGEHDRSAVEYLRFAYKNPDDALARWSLFRAGRELEKDRNFHGARAIYKEIVEKNPCDSFALAGSYRSAVSFFNEGLLFRVVDFEPECKKLDDEKFHYSSNYLKGWAFFLGRDYTNAESIFARIPDEFADSSALFMREKSHDGLNIPKKSPILAASMSAIIPGAGRAYLGRWGDALIDLIAVGGTLGGGYATFENDRTFAIGLLILGIILYGGNVYGSYVGTCWQNEEIQLRFYEETRNHVNRRPEELYDY